MSVNVAYVQRVLKSAGFDPNLVVDDDYGPRTRAAVKQFQIAWAGGRGDGVFVHLSVDGVMGVKTQAAFAQSTIADIPAGTYDLQLSPHFRASEFRDRVTGHVFPHRSLLLALEELRSRTGSIPIRSGSRTWETHKGIYARLRQRVVYGSWHLAHKTEVMGVYASYAADVSSLSVRANKDWVKTLRLFSGIGWVRSTKYVSHLDTRTNRSTRWPSMWSYNR